jgi:hypothetical protein
MEIGYRFQENVLTGMLSKFNLDHPKREHGMPWLAALVCCSPFDIALHDAYGQLHERPVYESRRADATISDVNGSYQPQREGERQKQCTSSLVRTFLAAHFFAASALP